MKKSKYMFLWIVLMTIVGLYIFSQFRIRETLAMTYIDQDAINRKCQTEYMASIRKVLTGPTIDPKNGYVSNKDVFNRVNAVKNGCQWNNETPIEEQYAKFKKVLSDTSDTNQINNLLIAIS
jgi:hypothetical protein